jgi:hypothetical protein
MYRFTLVLALFAVWIVLIAHSVECQVTPGMSLGLINGQSNGPIVDVPFVSHFPAGIGDNPDGTAWNSAAKVDLLINDGPYAGKAPMWPTRVYLAWDNNNLHILFTCYDKSILSVQQNKIDPSWQGDPTQQDFVQVALAPNNNILHYYSFTYGPNRESIGAVVTALGEMVQVDRKWSPGDAGISAIHHIKTAKGGVVQCWTVEATISWRSISASIPTPGSYMPANFMRVDNSAADNYSAWNPSYQALAYSSRSFGTLHFLGQKLTTVTPSSFGITHLP